LRLQNNQNSPIDLVCLPPQMHVSCLRRQAKQYSAAPEPFFYIAPAK
jgi:hypothetical protein